MIISASQASMSILNMVGGGADANSDFRRRFVILLVALFVVILVCLFNLRYYISEGNPSSDRRSWRGWFSLRDGEDYMKGGKAIKAIEIDCEKGQIIRNPPLTALQPRSTIRRTLLEMTPNQPDIPLSLPLPPVQAHSPIPVFRPNVEVPPAVIIKPRSRKNSEASDNSMGIKPPPYKPPSPASSRKSTLPNSFEAATGIGMGPTYRPPQPPPPSVLSHVQPGVKSADLRNSIAMEFQHYFNPFSWVATGVQEGKDLDSREERVSATSFAPQQGEMKEAVL